VKVSLPRKKIEQECGKLQAAGSQRRRARAALPGHDRHHPSSTRHTRCVQPYFTHTTCFRTKKAGSASLGETIADSAINLLVHPGENNYQQSRQEQGRQRWWWQAAVQERTAMKKEDDGLLSCLLQRSYHRVCPSWSAETVDNVGEQ
jgi:hypothetical protein